MIGDRENIIKLEKLNSTNEYALSLYRSNAALREGTVIITDNQTAGKGLDKNRWESEPGKNLTFSVCLFPHFLPVEKQFELNKALSLGIYDFVRETIPDEKVTVKWPNDIYINDEKVAGILINNTIKGDVLDFTVAGFGININQTEFYSDAPNPVSLIKFTGKELSLEESLDKINKKLNVRYEQLWASRFSQLDSDYLKSLYLFNKTHTFGFGGGTVEAKITGISEYGHLQLITSRGKKLECDLKEISFRLSDDYSAI
jgi:BirA family biotin operon repressor/biotin-[acetyl-CoA-carboxylase] ligase